jgi:hypothetical protein
VIVPVVCELFQAKVGLGKLLVTVTVASPLDPPQAAATDEVESVGAVPTLVKTALDAFTQPSAVTLTLYVPGFRLVKPAVVALLLQL